MSVELTDLGVGGLTEDPTLATEVGAPPPPTTPATARPATLYPRHRPPGGAPADDDDAPDDEDLAFDRDMLRRAVADTGRWARGIVHVEAWVFNEDADRLVRPEGAFWFDPAVVAQRGGTTEEKEAVARLVDREREDFVAPDALAPGVGMAGALWTELRLHKRGSGRRPTSNPRTSVIDSPSQQGEQRGSIFTAPMNMIDNLSQRRVVWREGGYQQNDIPGLCRGDTVANKTSLTRAFPSQPDRQRSRPAAQRKAAGVGTDRRRGPGGRRALRVPRRPGHGRLHGGEVRRPGPPQISRQRTVPPGGRGRDREHRGPEVRRCETRGRCSERTRRLDDSCRPVPSGTRAMSASRNAARKRVVGNDVAPPRRRASRGRSRRPAPPEACRRRRPRGRGPRRWRVTSAAGPRGDGAGRSSSRPEGRGTPHRRR